MAGKASRTVETMRQIAQSDRTFDHSDGHWYGKCLICNGKLSFRDADGFGANIEHITARVIGGTDDLTNLGLTHPRCNSEKGVHWDSPKRRHSNERNTTYGEMVARLQERRQARWRDPEEAYA